MQKRAALFGVLIILAGIFAVLPPAGAEDRFRAIRQLSNEVSRLSQDMVFHGSEGHTHEIVSYGKKMVEQAEKLMSRLETVSEAKKQEEMAKIRASLKNAIEKATQAVQLGEQHQNEEALAAARKASFHAKQTRQWLRSLR